MTSRHEGSGPRAFGPYQVIGTLGQGGMGVVYEARHEGSGERVALKALRAPSVETIGNIRREIQALATLDHPGIVRILDSGVQEGKPWYAMPLLEGTTLARREAHAAPPVHGTPESADRTSVTEKSQPRPEEHEPARAEARGRVRRLRHGGGDDLRASLSLVARLCGPLRYLHGEGLVHRDLKPANVLVTAGGMPVIIDFGLIARFTADVSRETAVVSGLSSGTLGYMAPEQLRGGTVDARADLYSLGCILFELVTGLRPFVAAGAAGLAALHLSAPAPSPSELVEGLPPGLDAVVARLLAKAPGDRFGYADDVARALRELGADADPEAPWPARATQAGEDKPARRARPYLYRPGLTGRARELAELDGVLDGVLRGRPAIVLLSGESGVGKTRLLAELARRALERRAEVVLGGCSPEERAPLRGFTALLRHIADRCREGGAGETRRLLGTRLSLLAPYEASIADLPGASDQPAPAELPDAEARRRLVDSLTECLAILAGDAPLLVGIDDAQWADDLTFATLEQVQRLIANRPLPVMLVVASRREEPREEIERLASLGATKMTVGRVDAGDVGTIAKEMLALPHVPGPFTRFLARESQGNPLFVAEYLRAAVDRGILTRDEEGRWLVVEGERIDDEAISGALPIPSSLQELVASHVDVLDADSREILEAAAVLGRDVRLELLGSVSGRTPEELARPLLDLRRRHLLEPAAVTAADGASFGHDKVREVVYARMPAEQRTAVHRRAAEALERLPDAARRQAAAELGRHWEAAGVPSSARPCYLAAARAARKEHALGAAGDLFRRYLALVDEPTDESIDARRELAADVLAVVGLTGKAEEELRAAFEDARRLGLRDLVAKTLVALGSTERRTGRFRDAQSTLEAALGLARAIPDRALEAATLSELAVIHVDRGSLTEGCRACEHLLGIYRELGARDAEGAALGHLANVLHRMGRMDESLERFQQALARHRETGNLASEGSTLANLASLHFRQGHLADAVDCYERALEIHARTGNREFEAIAIGNLAVVHAELGRLSEARAGYDRAIGIHREMGLRWLAAQLLGNRGVLSLRQNRLEEARADFEAALEGNRDVGDPGFQGIMLANLALAHCERGDLERATELALRAITIHREAGDRFSLANSLEGYARIASAQGRHAAARAALEEGRSLAKELGDRRMEAVMKGELAGSFAFEGDLSGGLALYEEALVAEREVGERFYEGIHRGAMARALLATGGDLVRVRDLLRMGEALLLETGNEIELARLRCVRGHLELASAPGPGARPPAAAASLLASAREVAGRTGAGPRSPLGRDIATLERALAERGGGGTSAGA